MTVYSSRAGSACGTHRVDGIRENWRKLVKDSSEDNDNDGGVNGFKQGFTFRMCRRGKITENTH